jgi:anti-sigma-K factor RskA
MSDRPPTDFTDDVDGEDFTAAEYALGVLDKDDRAAAEARSAREPAFAQAVLAWVLRLEPLIDKVAPVEPSAALWPRISAATDPKSASAFAPAPTPANDAPAPRGPGMWRTWAVGASAIAAIALLFIAIRPPLHVGGGSPANLVSQGGRTLVATLTLTETKASAFTVAYDPARATLYATPAGDFSIPRARAAELWLIPADGKPRPVGLVDPSKAASMPMPAPFKALAREKAVLALSIEPPGGSPTGSPTGPVVATGPLLAV